MAAVQTRKNKVGNFLKKEFWPEDFYCRKSATITYAGLAKREPGEVVYKANDAASAYVAVPAAITLGTANIAIIVDENIDDLIAADLALGSPTGSVTATVMYRGPAVVRKGGLSFADATDIADAWATLEAKGIKVVDYFSTYSQS